MKPGFALSLSAEGIVLLHRAAGGWRNVGLVPLDAPDLPADLAKLRTRGDALEADGQCKLIIPNDQIRYLTIETGSADLATRQEMARAALEGATPYAVDELTFDLSEDGAQTHIAAVARETLAEAESFALDNGFKPVSFVAVPGDMNFLGEPFFGTASVAEAGQVEPDGIAVVDIGPAEIPSAKDQTAKSKKKKEPVSKDKQTDTDAIEAEAAQSSPKLPPAPEPIDPQKTNANAATSEEAETSDDTEQNEDDGPIAGFSSRRRKTPAPVAAPIVAAAGAASTSASENAAPAVEGVRRAAPSKSAAVVDTQNAKASPVAASPSGTGKAGQPAPAKPGTSNTGAAEKSVPVAPLPKAPVAPPDDAASTTVSAPSATPVASPPRSNGAKAAKQPKTLKPGQTKGKPRFLGLILTVALLLVMAAVAALALLSDSSIFSSAPLPHEQTPDPDAQNQQQPNPPEAVDQEAAPVVAPETDEAPPVSIAPQVSALPDQPDPGITELPEAAQTFTDTETGLQTSTDHAVLDALQGPESNLPLTPDEEALADGAGPDGDDTAELLDQAAQYAATGIWQLVPKLAEAPALISLDDIYIASIDNSDLSQDAIALPAATDLPSDAVPDALSSPAAPGRAFVLDPRGLVTATPEGTLNPDGVMVYLGRPSVTPPVTPDRSSLAEAAQEAAAEAENARLAQLSRTRPRPRPNDLVEQAERALLGGLSRAELAKVRPKPRPASLKTIEQESGPVSNLAITASVMPRARPTNFANLVDRARRSRAAATDSAPTSAAAVATIAPQTVSPSLPSSASVARQATVNNAINLRRLNLIGVFGTPADRRALIRLPSGRYKKVQVGDRIDGGTVVAIGESQLQYQKRGTNTTLKLPGN